MEIDGKFYGSTDPEMYRHGPFNTKEEAVDEVIREEFADEEGPVTVYVGKLKQHRPHLDADVLIEHAQEQAGEECGECADDFLSRVPRELVSELETDINNLFGAWLIRHNLYPTFGNIEDAEEIKVESVG